MSGFKLGNKEKRNFLRMDIEAEVVCKIRGTNEEFKGLSKNLSHTGLQITTPKHVKEGAELEVTVKVDGGINQPPLKAVMLVNRVDKKADDEYVVSGKMKDVR